MLKRSMGGQAGAGWAALLVGLAGCAAPPVVVPVCGQADVLQRVEDDLHRQGQVVVLDPPVGEVSTAAVPPTGAPLVAHCAVRAHTVGFNTNRFGTTPVYEPFTVHYTTELRHNGVFVRVD